MMRMIVFITVLLINNFAFGQASNLANEYIIRAEDNVEVFVWQNSDLSRRTEVQMDGQIYLPLIGHIQAAGLTPKQLEQQITKKLAEYLKEPQVSVIMTGFADKVVYILGEVKSPGKYILFKDMKLSELIAISGSFTEYAVLGKVEILRRISGKTEIIKPDMRMIMKGETEDIILQIGDTIFVPRSPLANWNAFLGKINPTITFIFTVSALLALIFVKQP